MKTTADVIDKAAMALSGGLMLLGIVVLGVVEVLAGKPYGAAPVTNDAGKVIATPFVDPNIRTLLVVLGLLVLAVYAAYKLVAEDLTTEERATAGAPAD